MKETIKSDIDTLKEHYPEAFKAHKPLKIKIIEDLFADEKTTGLSRKKIRLAIRFWCTGPRYLEALLAKGAVRVDLGGNTVEPVSKEHQEDAGRRLKLLEERRKKHGSAKKSSKGGFEPRKGASTKARTRAPVKVVSKRIVAGKMISPKKRKPQDNVLSLKRKAS